MNVGKVIGGKPSGLLGQPDLVGTPFGDARVGKVEPAMDDVQLVASVSSLGHKPPAGAKWEFDASVTAAFEDMLERSIPDYKTMRDAVHRLALRFAKPHTDIVDLGASRGRQVEPLFDALGALNRWVLVEKAPAMLEVLRARFKCAQECGYVQVKDLDLRKSYPAAAASVTLAVLTLQFVPIEHRARVIQDAYDRTLPGGALIVVEKVLGGTSKLASTFIDEYHEHKRASGYSQDEIDAKALSLEGSLVPVSAEENERMLRAAGFKHVECFWRWMNFAGWLAVRS